MTSGASDPSDWLHKARQDARSARRLLTAPPELEVAAYHLQQAAEKAIKALLTAGGIKYPRGKGAGLDLDALAGLVSERMVRGWHVAHCALGRRLSA